jgi:hypothetical protein
MNELSRIKVLGLHKVPFNSARFEADLADVSGGNPAQARLWRKQIRQNWENAWIVCVEWSGTANSINFGEFAYPEPGPNSQAAWLEQVLEETASVTRAAFFLHYVEPGHLTYCGEKIALPPPTDAPASLLECMRYTSPD